MTSADRFRIGISAVAENVAITSGEVFLDDFSLVHSPVSAGYDSWATAIPDPGMRGTTDDASGNGIPNLLQYMYGLEPMAPDTDVTLRIRLEGGVPVLIHGLNETATDYVIRYHGTNALGGDWVPGADGDATSIESVSFGGKTLRKVMLPLNPENTFIQLELIPVF